MDEWPVSEASKVEIGSMIAQGGFASVSWAKDVSPSVREYMGKIVMISCHFSSIVNLLLSGIMLHGNAHPVP